MTTYDPKNREHRRALAACITAELDVLGFARDTARTGEAVYAREREPGVTVLVYTSIVGGEVRSLGKDAIRVATVYTGGERERGLGSETTIHRRGTIESITERVRERASHALGAVLPRCRRCNAPVFMSKNGNHVCAAICWERNLTPVVEAAKPSPAPAPASKPVPGFPTLSGRRRSRTAAVDW